MIKKLFRRRSPKARGRKINRSTETLWALTFFLLVSAGVCVAVSATLYYRSGVTSPDVAIVARTAHFPAGQVGSSIITEATVAQQRDALRTFAQSQAAQAPGVFQVPDELQLTQIVLDRLIRNAAMEALARQHGVRVTMDDVRKDFDSKVQAANVANVAQRLQEEFGLTVDAYQRLIVYPALLAEKMETVAAADPTVQADVERRAQAVWNAIKDSKEPLDKLVAQYSDDAEAAANGGDLGYKRKGELPDEVFEAALKLKPGQRSELIKAADGYHIIELIESVPPASDGTPVIHPREILIRRVTADGWLTQQLLTTTVRVFYPGLDWDRTLAQVLLEASVTLP